MGESLVEIIQKEIEFHQGDNTKKLINSIKGKQEWLANKGLDRSGQAAEFIHQAWASVVDPYVDKMIEFVTDLPIELNRDYTNEELDEIENLLQTNYSGLLQMKSTFYNPSNALPTRGEMNVGKNLRISIAIDKIRLKAKHKKNSLSDEFIIKSFDVQEKENKKNNLRFWLTMVLSIAAIAISIISMIISK